MSTTRRVFPEVFKREAVDRVISSGLSVKGHQDAFPQPRLTAR